MSRLFFSLFLVSVFMIDATTPLFSQKENKKYSATIRGKVAGLKAYEGYFNFYYDSKKGKIYLLIDKWDTEFLYVNSLKSGLGSNDIGLDRGQLGDTRVVKFIKSGPKVLLTQPNYKYRATTNNPAEKKAVEEAFAQSVLWGFTVYFEEGDRALVDVTEFLLRDAHGVIKSLKNRGQGSYKLEKSMSVLSLEGIKNFPENSELEALVTVVGEPEGKFVKSVAPDPTHITMKQHHSFIKLPDDGYQPRKFDPRAGFFGISYYDYATTIHASLEKKFIARHRLEKKDPTAVKSEPVEPIIYYLDPGTPEPIRSALLDGARWWNQAFDAIGYIDAFQVKILPEGADPMDVRYNVIQWVHRSTRGWSYGASVTDPRTGEIIKGHVSLGSLRVRQDYLIAEGLLSPYKSDETTKAMEEMALARLRQLAAHEVGHTLGLAHSYTSSAEGRASVMDYPHPQVRLKEGKIDLSEAYDNKIGAWDKVAIAYGYQDYLNPTEEKAGLAKVIKEALDTGLTFLSDQDARPQGGAHPYAHLWDNGKSAAEELKQVMKVREVALKQFGENTIQKGIPYAHLDEVLVPIYFFHRYQAEAAVKLIGGLDYRYAVKGDGQLITGFIDPKRQWESLDALIGTLSPKSLVLTEQLLKMIPPKPMGYSRNRESSKSKTGLTFDGIGMAKSYVDFILPLILHPERTNRLVQYHARENMQPGLSGILDRLIEKTWKSEKQGGYAGEVQRVVQSSLLSTLVHLANNHKASQQVRAVVDSKIIALKAWVKLKAKQEKDSDWLAHLEYSIKYEPEYIQEIPADIPPGSPIGTPSEYCGW